MMKAIVIRFLSVALVTSFFMVSVAPANEALIKEMESLRSSLAPDDHSRSTLTRRLADLYFQNSVKIEKDIVLKGHVDKNDEVTKNRKKALRYYKEALSGDNGKYKAADGQLKALIQFQIARIYKELGSLASAKKYLKAVYNNDQAPSNIRKESSLQLAEMLEQEGKFQASNQYYVNASDLCKTEEVCSYITYRLSWNHYRNNDIPEAVNKIRTVIFDSQGQVKEQVLQDFIVFIASMPGDGSAELKEIEELAKRLKRPELVKNMAEAFFAAGNREAGTNALYYVNQRTNNPYYEVRLLDEFYGFKNWDKFREIMDSLAGIGPNAFDKIDDKKQDEAKKILQRVIVQLDAERKSGEKINDDLQKTIDIYLAIYPQDKLRQKMIDGWLTAADDDREKLEKLPFWIDQEVKFKNEKQQKRLRKMRLSLAQKLEEKKIVMQEAQELAKLFAKDSEENRKYRYIVAHYHYKQNNNDQALPIFLELADFGESLEKKPDEFAVKSINLALDIYNQKKDYQNIITLAKKWATNEKLQSYKSIAKDMKELTGILEQAQFEQAVAMGETKEALRTFEQYCYNNKFPKKACPNVKVLAVKLGDQESLMKILAHNKDEKAMMAEYELMGKFGEAAKLMEKYVLTNKADITDYLKVSLFYDLAQDVESRNKILKQLMAKLKRKGSMPEKLEPVIFNTFKVAGLYDANLLSLPWSTTRKMRMVEDLENRGKGNRTTRNIIAKSDKFMGAEWVRIKLKRLEKLNKLQAKRTFYGRNSKKKFQRRINALDKFAEEAKVVLNEADVKTRVFILDRLATAYTDLGDEIAQTPIPKILEDQQKMQFAMKLQEMAKPFYNESEEYLKRMEEQLVDLEDPKERQEIKELAKLEVDAFADEIKEIKEEKIVALEELNLMEVQPAFTKLEKNPNSKEALSQLRDYFEDKDQPRAASYFKDRLESLEAKI